MVLNAREKKKLREYISKQRKNKKYRHEENRAKIVNRIQTDEDYVPRESTLEKYDLTFKAINQLRKLNGLEPFDQKKTQLLSILTGLTDYLTKKKLEELKKKNADKVRIYKEIIENRREINEQEEEIDDHAREARNTVNTDSIDFENFTLDDFKKFMGKKPQPLATATIRYYTNKIKLIYEYIFDEKITVNYPRFMRVFKETSVKELEQEIIAMHMQGKDGEPNVSSISNYWKPINFILREFPGVDIYLGKKKADDLRNVFKKYKNLETTKATIRAKEQTKQEIHGFKTFYKRTIRKFGVLSLEAFLLYLYDNVPGRSMDYGGMVFITDLKNDDGKKNFLLKRGAKMQIILNAYKQSNTKGKHVRDVKLHKNEIDKFLKHYKFVNGDVIFDAQILPMLRNMIDVTEVKTADERGINYLRKSIAHLKTPDDMMHDAGNHEIRYKIYKIIED